MEYSLTGTNPYCVDRNHRLNPYSNGILTDLEDGEQVHPATEVLILILMEYSLTNEVPIESVSKMS